MPEDACAPEVVLGVVSLGAAALGLGGVSAGAGVGDDSAVDGVADVEDVLVSLVLADGGVGSLETPVLLDEVLAAFVDFLGAGLAAGASSVFSVAVAGSGAGVATAGVPESATIAGFASVAVVVSLVGEASFEDARLEVGPAKALAGFDATSWLNRNAPAITRAMITPKAMGKCFTEASCWDSSPVRTGAASRRCGVCAGSVTGLHAHARNSDSLCRSGWECSDMPN